MVLQLQLFSMAYKGLSGEQGKTLSLHTDLRLFQTGIWEKENKQPFKALLGLRRFQEKGWETT